MSVIDLNAATKVKDLQVGAHLSHPEGIAVDGKGRRAYVAVANADQVAVIDTGRMVVERTLSTARPEGDGTAPVDIAVTPDHAHLVVAEEGADELSVFRLPARSSSPRPRTSCCRPSASGSSSCATGPTARTTSRRLTRAPRRGSGRSGPAGPGLCYRVPGGTPGSTRATGR